jgi:hypothetical protein
MKTQWEHPKTGKKKRCAGGLSTSKVFIWLKLPMHYGFGREFREKSLRSRSGLDITQMGPLRAVRG